MRLADSPAGAAFRAELRDWLSDVVATLPPAPDKADWSAVHAFDSAWQKLLHDGGYAGIHWPKEYGGRGATPEEHLIFLEETAEAGAPSEGVNFVGLLHAGPTLITEASDAQKAAHLPAILRGDEVWCQGFSEPNAGSDLASLSTRAVRDGDHYVISGQKIWTSFAQIADYCEMLVRTDLEAPKHRGITWLIMPMDLPGIEVRPIKTALGASEFSEVFLDEVRVPVENRVGAENDGWRVAMVTFSFERGTAFISELLGDMRDLRELAELSKKVLRSSGTAWDDLEIRRELGRLQGEYDALWALTKRNVSQAARTGVPGPGGSVFKLYYADVKKRASALAYKILGRMSLGIDQLGDLSSTDFVGNRIYVLSASIAAGTTQIQRNIVGERILGLPKER
jgi:alkylation response protein AidB-like acyl-CoA dehydrogenase